MASSSSSSSSSSSPSAVDSRKRAYSRVELEALCVDMDNAATATAIVSETTNLDQVREIRRAISKATSRLHALDEEVLKAKRQCYGKTFYCSTCKKEQFIERRMGAHVSEDDYYSSFFPNVCHAEVCYDCAMKSPTNCDSCRRKIFYWRGGPMPYIVVGLLLSEHSKVCYRFEFDPKTTTLRQVKEAMVPLIGANYKFSSISVVGEKRAKLDSKLKDIGVSVGERMYGGPSITVLANKK